MASSTGQRQLREDPELRRLVEQFLDGVGRLQSLSQFRSDSPQRPQVDELAAMAGEIQRCISSLTTDTDEIPQVISPAPASSANDASRALGTDGLRQRRLRQLPATTSSTTGQGSPTAGGQRQRHLQQPITTASPATDRSHVPDSNALRQRPHRQTVPAVRQTPSYNRWETSSTLKEMFPRGGMIYEPGRYILNSPADEDKLQDTIQHAVGLAVRKTVMCYDVDVRLARIFREATDLTIHVNPRDNFPSETVSYHERPFIRRSRYYWQDDMPDQILETTMSKLVQARYRAIESSKNIQQNFAREGYAVGVIDRSLGDQPRRRPTLWFGDYVLARELGLTGPPQRMGDFNRLDKDRARRPQHDPRQS